MPESLKELRAHVTLHGSLCDYPLMLHRQHCLASLPSVVHSWLKQKQAFQHVTVGKAQVVTIKE